MTNHSTEQSRHFSILFLCTGNSCRSQIAEGFVRDRRDERVAVFSAGTEIKPVHPLAIQVMEEIGIDISAAQSKTLDSLDGHTIDVLITLCDHAAGNCPVFPGNPTRVDWNLEDPAMAQGETEVVLDIFRCVRDQIKQLVDDLIDRGYLDALAHSKKQTELILSNLPDGIIAHDFDRKIYYFNEAAERITGYTRKEVIGKDCHDVFAERFCGADCHFCETGKCPGFDANERRVEIQAKNGVTRRITMYLKLMRDVSNRPAGVLVSLKDMTRELKLEKQLGQTEQFSGIIGRDPKMLEIFNTIRDLAHSSASVSIQGESGTGKELVAAAIHREGPRAKRLFVPINCGALPEGLLESELFGHIRGAFTGAIRDKKGRFELADGGTIFLDEIGDISSAMQVKLLRVLQEGTFERVGCEKTIKVDVRVISATNKDLRKEIREDLYYRLCVAPIYLPPLRERRGDIPLLAMQILKRALEENKRESILLSDEALGVMLSYDWPGNVRELQNWIQFALFKCKGDLIQPVHFPPRHYSSETIAKTQKSKPKQRKRKLYSESVQQALTKTGGNKQAAARELGVSRATLYRFLDENPS
jgi:sigma-54 dependent transcriptional regulator, acetoin dehydrogenase operon transcriptional activator AcoR